MPGSSIFTRRTTARGRGERLDVLADVVDAEDRGAALEGGDRGPHRRGRRARRASGSPRSLPSELLRESPTRTGRPSATSTSRPAHELEVLLDRLAEADARVEADPLLGDAGRDRERQPLLEERRDLRDDVVVARVALHRPRLALHVHQAEVGAGVGDDAGQLRIAAEGGDVVHQLGAERERAAARPRPSRCRSRRATPAQALEHRHDAAAAPRRATTPSEPGRVDSPPTSTIAAPSSSIRRAADSAALRLAGERRRRRSCRA